VKADPALTFSFFMLRNKDKGNWHLIFAFWFVNRRIFFTGSVVIEWGQDQENPFILYKDQNKWREIDGEKKTCFN